MKKTISSREEVEQNLAEIMHVMRWYLSQRPRLMLLAYRFGGLQDAVQEAATELLQHPPKREVTLTTLATNSIRWILLRRNDQRKNKLEARDREEFDFEQLLAAEETPPVEQQDLQLYFRATILRLLTQADSEYSRSPQYGPFNVRKNTDILYSRVVDGIPLSELAEHYSVTRERIRQLEYHAIGRLRTLPEAEEQLKSIVYCDETYRKVETHGYTDEEEPQEKDSPVFRR